MTTAGRALPGPVSRSRFVCSRYRCEVGEWEPRQSEYCPGAALRQRTENDARLDPLIVDIANFSDPNGDRRGFGDAVEVHLCVAG